MSKEEAKAGAERMESIARTLRIREEERARKGFADWIKEMLKESVGKLHKWSKEEDPTGGTAVNWDESTSTFISNPNEVLKMRSKDWGKIWQCDDDKARTRTSNAVKRARSQAKAGGEKSTLVATGRNIANACGSFKKKTSVGLDLWALAELAECDLEDLDRLGRLMMEWDSEMVAPSQWLVNLLNMIPKKKGHRCIATMASGYRCFTSLEEDIDKRWNVEHSHEDDTSKPDASCLRAAEERLIEQEILVINDYQTLVILWDFVKFYDTMRYDVLAKECDANGYGKRKMRSQ